MSWKHPRSGVFFTDYYDESGRRIRVSTKKRTKREGDLVEAEMMNRAARVRHGLEVRDRNPGRYTVAKAATWWLDTVAAKQAQGPSVRPVVERHIVKSALAGLLLEQVTPGHVKRWLHEKSGGDLSANSVNHLRAYLMGIFTKANEFGLWLGSNPVKETKRLGTDEPESRALPASYVLPLIDHAPTPGWRVVVAVAAFAGMRRSEIERVLAKKGWPDIDFDERIIRVSKTKAKKNRRVAIHPGLWLVLSDARERNVRPPSAGAYLGSNDIISAALRRAGLDDEGATFHGLRGTWATQMQVCGALDGITEYMGWGARTSSVMRRHYQHPPAEALRREIDKLWYPTKEEA